MNKLAFLITGDQPKHLENFSPRSRKKVLVLGWSVLLPTLIWFGLGFGFCNVLLQVGWMASLVGAILASFVIFSIDRLIIMTDSSNNIILITRVALALSTAFLGGIVWDHVLLKGDVEQEISRLNELETKRIRNEVDAEYRSDKERLIGEVEVSRISNAKSQDSFVSEIQAGPGSSGNRGRGEIANGIAEISAKRENQFAESQNELEGLKSQIQTEKDERVATFESSRRDDAILTQIHAMFSYLWNNPIGLVLYIPMYIVMMILECLPLLIKFFSSKTAYEKSVEVLEEIGIQKAELLLNQMMSSLERQKAMSKEDRMAIQLVQNQSFLNN
jgi:hypothetical protein